MVASAPIGNVEVPDAVRAFAGDVSAVWQNEAGGLTFRSSDGALFLKWSPRDSGLRLSPERERLAWAQGRHPVPEVVGFVEHLGGDLLVTRALPGDGAVTPRWLADPRRAVRAIGAGLRALHDALPVDECPFEWSPESRLARLAPGRRDEIGSPPPVDRLVVCHGDPCAPNTVIGPDGRWAGHVDLGALGVSDRWADLAVASMSLEWNYGPGWDAQFFDAYGVRPEPDRIRYFRALWDAGE